MKKLIYCAAALVTALFAGSCQRELLDPAAQGNTVTYTVNMPQVATKAVVGEADNVDNLVYAVYRVLDSSLSDEQAKAYLATKPGKFKLIYQETTPVFKDTQTGKKLAHVSLELINDQRYVVIFWAQNGETWVEANEDFRTVSYPKVSDGNNDAYDAFTNVDVISVDGSFSKDITLVRPFAQLNIATVLPGQTQNRYKDFAVSTTEVFVEGIASRFNVGAQTGETTGNVRFAAAAPLTQPFNATYPAYISMNYVFVPANQSNVKVSYDIVTNNYGTVKNTVPNVPVARNYRTNIVGNLLTSDVQYNVELAPWAENSNTGTTEVIVDGLVKNQKGDYEISNENGLAYAMNNRFALGGDFYLTKALYDLTGYAVNPPAVPAGVVLNIYGETPVVTRAASTLAGIKIIGLPEVEGTPTLIAQVEEGGSVSVSGVTLDDEGSVLVENNEGTLVISETEVKSDSYVGEGKEPVQANNIDSLAALKAALATGVKNIDITGNIVNENKDDVLLINNSVTINGNEKIFTTSASRAFRLTTSDIEVTFNNLNIVSEAVRVGTNDVRGVSVDIVDNITLTLNDCSHDFTDLSANDWAYAVNVTGGTNHTVTVNGGEYEGANVINVRGTAQTVTVKNATLNSTYPNNDVYYGSCIWVQEKQGSSVYAEGNTFNGDNAIAFNLGTGTALEEKDNVDNTKMVVAKVGEAYYTSLAEAFAAESGATVKVLQNTKMDAVTVANGKTITLELNGKTVTGVDTEAGSYGLITNKGNLTVHGPGAIKLSANTNRGWNAYSSVISNTVGGKLVVDAGAVIEHLGGTDMAYGIDNLTNGKGTSAIATVDGATVKSVYRAIRQFLNGVEATNELYVKANSRIYGPDNKSIWMQDPSKNANTGKLVVEEGAELYGDVYLTVTAGSTEWPVSASIPASVLKEGSQVLTTNVPAGYSVENVGGVWEVIAWTSVSTADELIAALEANKSVVFANNIKIEPANMSNAYGTTGINVKNGQSIDGNGHTLNIKGAGGTWDSGINTTGGLIKNLTVTGSFRGIFINHNSTHSEKVVLENVTITGTVYTISCDQGLYQGIEATNCTFNGWTSFAKTAGEAKFINCSFGEGNGNKYCRPYSNTEFVNCTFCPGYAVDETQATVTFTDCTWEE